MDFEQIRENLKQVGLGHNESKIYLTLLKLGPSMAGRIAKESNIDRSACYDSLKALLKKGLVSYAIEANRKKFAAANPERLKSYLQTRIELVDNVLGNLKDMYKNTNVKFRMQTNAKLLNKLDMNYLNKIDKILISIDGDKERTDLNKGKGTYDLIIKNIKSVRKQGYKGEIIARMTLSPPNSDLYEQVKHILSTNLFDSIHWQLDAGFYKSDYNRDFKGFSEDYNKNITKLIDFWLEEMKNKKVLRLYPFVAIVNSLLKNERTLLRCGAGQEGYAISTTGKIIACPIMNCIVDFEAGNIDSNPNKLKKFNVGGKCLECNYLDLCGGRCLYWNKANLWPEEGNELICNTIKHLIDELKKRIPEIKQLIENKIIKQSDFEYEKYFGPEIIP